MTPTADGPDDATPITRAKNRALLDALPFQDTQDFEDARRGSGGSPISAMVKAPGARATRHLSRAPARR